MIIKLMKKFLTSPKQIQIYMACVALSVIYCLSYIMLKGTGVPGKFRYVILMVFFIVLASSSKKVFWLIVVPMVFAYALYIPIGFTYGPLTYDFFISVISTDVQEKKEFVSQIPYKYFIYSLVLILGIFFYKYLISRFNIQFYKNKTFLLIAVFTMLSTQIPAVFPKQILFNIKTFYQEYKVLKKRPNSEVEIIAHAGGKIENFIYVNSLESLNSSYQQGARLLELDISETSDNQFVAVHDWAEWKEKSGFLGELPPTHEEFKNHKIHGKFTPLDIADINKWFGNHKDAILITDKVNEPKKFRAQFVDPTRLNMELFTISAIEEFLQDGGKPEQIWANYYTFTEFNNTELQNIFNKYQITNIVAGAPEDAEIQSKLRILKGLDVKVNMYLFGSTSDIEKQVEQYSEFIDRVYFDNVNCEKYMCNSD